jgi:hypothetical protein
MFCCREEPRGNSGLYKVYVEAEPGGKSWGSVNVGREVERVVSSLASYETFGLLRHEDNLPHTSAH